MPCDDLSPLPAEVQARFQAAVAQFHSECCWSWDLSQPIVNRSLARQVIRALRLHGGKPGWQAAAELVRCL